MKVKELVKRLQQEDQELEVVFGYNYGDYWRTQVLAPIDEIDQCKGVMNARLEMHAEFDEDFDGEKEVTLFLKLS